VLGRRPAGQVTLDRTEAEIRQCIHNGLTHGDRGYQAILAGLAREKKNRQSCVQLLELVDAARGRIRTAVAAAKRHVGDEADVDAAEVTDRVEAVRNHARQEHGMSVMRDVRKLRTGFPGGQHNHKVRIRAFKAADHLLASIGTNAGSALKFAKSREKGFEVNRAERLEQERRRFK
jgi:hypothetical protein